jgi:glucose-6-phosphate dehydrogenase assembly protein OpcA
MAPTLADHAWRESAPESVEHDLAALWREIGSREKVARAVMSNLVVFRLHERRMSRRPKPDDHGADPGLDAVIARHPSRAIVIEHERGEHETCAPFGATVGISVFGPPAARYAVEQVVVRAACAGASLPSIVRRFVRGDLPTTVWWTEDLSRASPLAALIAEGRQMLYDSRRWRDVRGGIRALAPLVAGGQIDLADSNWRRLTPLRHALVHSSASLTTSGPPRVRIDHRPGDAALGWLLAGWLAARLHWAADFWPEIAELRQGDDDVLSLRMGDGDAAVAAVLNGHRVVIKREGTPPLIVPVPRTSEADALATELRSLSFEPAFRDTLVELIKRCALR